MGAPEGRRGAECVVLVRQELGWPGVVLRRRGCSATLARPSDRVDMERRGGLDEWSSGYREWGGRVLGLGRHGKGARQRVDGRRWADVGLRAGRAQRQSVMVGTSERMD